MANDALDIDVLYTLYQNDDTRFYASPEDAPIIDRAMKLWAESRRDSWVSVHAPDGGEFSVLASTINSTTMTTSADRRDATMRDKLLDDERKAFRRDAGFIESE